MNVIVKRTIVLLTLLGLAVSSFAQFRLSGKIINYTGKEELNINIPVISGFNKENSIHIPITKKGTFAIHLPIKGQKFAELIFKRKFYTLLLNPNKNLVLQLNESDKTLKLLNGTALAENKMMQAVDLEQYPFFMDNDGNNRFAKLPLKELQKQVLLPYFAQRDEKIKKVQSSTLALKDKQAIAAELKYISYNYLNDLARTQAMDRSVMDSLIFEIFDNIDPKPQIFPAGPQYYAFVRNYLSYLETKAFKQIQKENIKPNELIPYFGISLDSANIIVKNYGKPYWRWIGSNKNFPANVVEQYNYHQLIGAFIDKDLRQFEGLANVFKSKFPNSVYVKDIDQKLGSLKNMLVQNEHNTQIQIIDGYEKIASIYEVTKAFKGKVVYLDVWGTWCGPCKEELPYLPDLKAKFKDKAVVFVYLDMDEDNMDSSWRQFIKVNNLTGIHLRKSRQTIAPFWKELLANATDKAEYYPQYFIFDKEGKLVVAKAKRPSAKEELYTQLNNVLNKNQ
jgi:thiol-disulfide isomerase/thioredoxin